MSLNRSFPTLVRANLGLLRHKSRIKEFFKQSNRYPFVRVLLVCREAPYSALVTIAQGIITVSDIRNKKEFFKNYDYNGYVEAGIDILMKILYGRISNLQIIPLMLKKKIKIKGMKELLKFQKIINVLVTKTERNRWKNR